ncbi:hypothetical protein CCAX7_008020 [Capsulimonas corticalis]|uniref:Uncharacterized protein n=1 Tax=Capsulimonas corticalis TaxID=2219043 RepID=A0A402CTU8_9BACT|nr:sigma-70 family RNA polymerase sigma factor [Capsulimonas corticalis]BDI28751.1 hypothetical protein CCAX7_008020 [Capsulimonas corticalis]
MQTRQRHDWDLVRQYARHGSQAAFDELVRRHMKLVYTTCRRELGDPWLAEDVTQVVFLILSRKAGMLPPGAIVSRWLFKTARFASQDVRKREARRLAREASLRAQASASAEVDSGDVSALDMALLSALGSLGRSDWEAVQFRFYEEMSFHEIGERYGISDDAAQKRVSRAVDRIRRAIAHEGICLTAATIAALIGSENSQAAPNTALQRIEQASSLPGSVHSGALAVQSKIYGLTKGVLTAMALKNMATAALVLVVALTAGAPLIVQGQSNPSAATPAVTAPAGSADSNSLPFTIVLDPGHGGSDSGATSSGPGRVLEKDLDLAIALKLRDLLAAKGARVFLTRDSDVYSIPSKRARIGVNHHTDFFLSIHCGSTSRETISGTTVYYHAQNKAAQSLAVSVLNGVAQQSVLPAYGAMSDTTRFTNGFSILREQPSNAILIQCGFMSNPLDLSALTDPEKQTRIAQGIVDGLTAAASSRK